MYRKSIAGKVKIAVQFLFHDDYVIDNYAALVENNQRTIDSMKATIQMLKKCNLAIRDFSDKVAQQSEYCGQTTKELQGRLNELNLLLKKHREKISGFQENSTEENFKNNSYSFSSKKDNILSKLDICVYLGVDMEFPDQDISIVFSNKLKKEHPDHARENYDDRSFLELLFYYKSWKGYLEQAG